MPYDPLAENKKLLDCPHCGSRRYLYVRVPETRLGFPPGDRIVPRKCPHCFLKAFSLACISPLLRGSDEWYHPSWDTVPPLPMMTVTGHGSWTGFRHAVWRSLLHYNEARGHCPHEIVMASRLGDIQMSRESNLDEGYSSRRELAELPLLVLVVLTAGFGTTGSLATNTFMSLVEERAAESRPTWLYTSLTGNALTRHVGEDFYKMWIVPSMRRFGDTADGQPPVSPAPPSVRRSDEPDGSGPTLVGQPEDASSRGRSSRDRPLSFPNLPIVGR